MNENANEKWAFSLDGENYHGMYASPEEALDAGKDLAGCEYPRVFVVQIQEEKCDE